MASASEALASTFPHSPLLDFAASVSHSTDGLSAKKQRGRNGCLEQTCQACIVAAAVVLPVVFFLHIVNGLCLLLTEKAHRRRRRN